MLLMQPFNTSRNSILINYFILRREKVRNGSPAFMGKKSKVQDCLKDLVRGKTGLLYFLLLI